MAELKSLICPKCGAQVELEPGRERGTCTYCGTTAYVENPRRTEPKAGARARTPAPSRLVLVAVAGAIAVGLTAVVVALMVQTPAPVAPPIALPLKRIEHVDFFTQTPSEDAGVRPAPVATIEVESAVPARLIDSDGDKVDELVLAFQQTLEHKTSYHFGVFSTADGALRSQTPGLESLGSATLSAVAFGRLVLAQASGQLSGYDLVSGAQQWSTALGEHVAALCIADARAIDSLHVVTTDDRNLLVDVKTGRQTETKKTCQVPLAITQGNHAPSDRRDYRAPEGVEAWHCGGVRVMGDQNYQVPDACRARGKVDTDHLDGMVGHAIWRMGKDWLVFGVRKPGTYVPSVGLLARGQWVWKAEVPAQDPLEAETGGPRLISLWQDRLLIGYASGSPRGSWVTYFDARDGTRRWSVGFPAQQPLVALVQNERVMVAQTSRSARLLSPDSGALLATIGSLD